jgi:hypothetical protein
MSWENEWNCQKKPIKVAGPQAETWTNIWIIANSDVQGEMYHIYCLWLSNDCLMGN